MRKHIKNKNIFYLICTLLLIPGWTHLYAQEELYIEGLNGQYTILDEASIFTFKAKTFGLFTVKGTIGGINGVIDFNQINSDKFIRLSLQPFTVNTGNNNRDDHLRSEDFLYVDEYPLIEFKGGKIELKDPENQVYEVRGKLTIRGVTNEEVIPATLEGYDNEQKNRIVFKGSLVIDRNKYEVDYTGRLIADEVKITYTLIAEKK